MERIIIACPKLALARFKIEDTGVDAKHPRLHYAVHADGVAGQPLGVRAVDLTDLTPGSDAACLRRKLDACQPKRIELSALAATLHRMDLEDRSGAAAVTRDRARTLAACIAKSRENAERYAARASASDARHEYKEATKLREWARRSREEADMQEQAGAELLAVLAPARIVNTGGRHPGGGEEPSPILRRVTFVPVE